MSVSEELKNPRKRYGSNMANPVSCAGTDLTKVSFSFTAINATTRGHSPLDHHKPGLDYKAENVNVHFGREFSGKSVIAPLGEYVMLSLF